MMKLSEFLLRSSFDTNIYCLIFQGVKKNVYETISFLAY